MSTPPTEFRMQLNNLLQANGGAGRLRWGDAVRGGPDHCPSWTIDAFLDGMGYGRGTGRTLDIAREEAARQVLRHLLAPNITR